MIRLKTLLEQTEIALPKTYAYNGHIVMIDPTSKTDYHYELNVDLLKDITVSIEKIDLKNRDITYKHPITGKLLNAELNPIDISKIAKQYKSTEVGDSIEGLKTADNRELLLTRIK